MKKHLRIKFVDEQKGHRLEDDYIFKLMTEEFDIEQTDVSPDYVFAVWVGTGDLAYPNAIKVCYIGENRSPDFNRFDYAIGFDHLDFGDRYLRIPLYAMYPCYQDVLHSQCELADDELLNRGFCSFVVTNSRHADPFRAEFFKRLSKYRRVDSGGTYLNNIGGAIKDKLDFVAKYKFNIAFENSQYPGYTTEKIIEPLAVHSVPIYYGDPLVCSDFNPDAIINIKSVADVERCVEEIIRLDKDDDLYLKKCRAKRLTESAESYDAVFRRYLHHIFDQPKLTARRLALYGNQPKYRDQLASMYKFRKFVKSPIRCLIDECSRRRSVFTK